MSLKAHRAWPISGLESCILPTALNYAEKGLHLFTILQLCPEHGEHYCSPCREPGKKEQEEITKFSNYASG